MKKKIVFLLFIIMALSKTTANAKEWEGYRRNVPVVLPNGQTILGYQRWGGKAWSLPGIAGDYCPYPIEISYDVTYNYEEAYKMIDLVNAERRKAGVPELKTNDRLMQVAMERAAETALYWDHTRPDGSSFKAASMFSHGENLHWGSNTAVGATESLIDSADHYANMLRSKYVYAGYGCVDGFWVQIFTEEGIYYEVDGYPDESKKIDLDNLPLTKKSNYSERITTAIDPKRVLLQVRCRTGKARYADFESNKFEIGDKQKVVISTKVKATNVVGQCYTGVELDESQYTFISLTPNICTIKGNEISFVGAGKARLQATLKADTSITITLEVDVLAKEIKKGTAFESDDNVYVVTDTKAKTVQYKETDSKASSITIPNTVKINGKTYKVTAVASKAFKSNKKVTSITIGKNVTTIGKEAFKDCKNLKKITIKTTKLKKVGSNSLKGIHKKAVIKVPKSKLKTYKKLFKGKGQSKNVKIKK